MTKIIIEADRKDNYIKATFSALKKQLESDLSCSQLVSTTNWDDLTMDYGILEGLLRCTDISNVVKIDALFNNVIYTEFYTHKESFKYIINIAYKCNIAVEVVLKHLALMLGNVVKQRCIDLGLNSDFNCTVSLIPDVDNLGHVYDKKYIYNIDNNESVVIMDNTHNEMEKIILEMQYAEEVL